MTILQPYDVDMLLGGRCNGSLRRVPNDQLTTNAIDVFPAFVPLLQLEIIVFFFKCMTLDTSKVNFHHLEVCYILLFSC